MTRAEEARIAVRAFFEGSRGKKVTPAQVGKRLGISRRRVQAAIWDLQREGVGIVGAETVPHRRLYTYWIGNPAERFHYVEKRRDGDIDTRLTSINGVAQPQPKQLDTKKLERSRATSEAQLVAADPPSEEQIQRLREWAERRRGA